MVRFTAYKNTFLILLNAILVVSTASCNESAKTSSHHLNNGSNSAISQGAIADNPPAEAKPYFGEDWDQAANKNNANLGNGTGAKTAPSGGADQADAAPPSADSTWSLVLGTFAEEGHAEAAQQMLGNLRTIAPQVTGARVHTTGKGSMVVYGNYVNRDDPQAKADQDRLKEISYQGHKVFNRVILTRLDLRWTRGQLDPLDLLSARKAHLNVDPLYTIDVAIWMTNPDAKSVKEQISFDEVRRKAEAYARELRAKNFEAYFYHDEQNQWSIVTVGLFDRRAIDVRSGLYSPDVDAMVRKFPVRLANGEPLMEFKDRFNPQLGTKPQIPKLVLVPSM